MISTLRSGSCASFARHLCFVLFIDVAFLTVHTPARGVDYIGDRHGRRTASPSPCSLTIQSSNTRVEVEHLERQLCEDSVIFMMLHPRSEPKCFLSIHICTLKRWHLASTYALERTSNPHPASRFTVYCSRHAHSRIQQVARRKSRLPILSQVIINVRFRIENDDDPRRTFEPHRRDVHVQVADSLSATTQAGLRRKPA